MKIAIVGTSKLTQDESDKALSIINELLSIDDILISGGAKGIDSIAEATANFIPIPKQIHYPPRNNWIGFKERNIIIAKSCDKLYCITTNSKTEKCYHCQENHDRTGGCWTMKYTKGLGKPTELIIIN